MPVFFVVNEGGGVKEFRNKEDAVALAKRLRKMGFKKVEIIKRKEFRGIDNTRVVLRQRPQTRGKRKTRRQNNGFSFNFGF